MKILPLLCTSLLLSSTLLFGQVVPAGTASARDGFTKSGTEVLLTRGGTTQKVENEIALENGLRVRPDGGVTLPSGEKATLRNNQLLTLQGAFEDAAISPAGTAPVTSGGAPLKVAGEEIGLSARDGVSVSSGEARVTRNGVTQRLTQGIKLTNGTRVEPNGTVTLTNGQQITLRADQVLTFDGAVINAPPLPQNVAPAARDGGTLPPGVTPR